MCIRRRGRDGPAHEGLVAGPRRFLEAPAQAPAGLGPVPEPGMGVAEPEVVRAGQRRIAEPFQPLLLLEEQVHDLLAAAQEVEGVSLADRHVDQAQVPLLGRELPGMGTGFFQRGHRLGVRIDPGRLLGEAGEVLHGLLGVAGPRVVIRQAIVGLVETVRVDCLEGPTCRLVEGLAPSSQQALVPTCCVRAWRKVYSMSGKSRLS